MKRFWRMAVVGSLLAGVVSPVAALVVVHQAPARRPARQVVVLRRPVSMATPVIIAGRPHGAIDLDVSPEETLVWVDGELRGKCDDFDGVPAKLYLLPGVHTLRLKLPGGEEHLQKIRVVAGREIQLSLRPPE